MRIIFVFVSVLLFLCSNAQYTLDSDVIIEWNSFYILHGQNPHFLVEPRELAMMNLAAHNAINSIDPVYEVYGRGWLRPRRQANLEAAVSSAFYTLYKLFIDSRLNGFSTGLGLTLTQRTQFHSDLEQFYTERLALIPNGNDKQDGIDVGMEAAQDMWEMRANDNWNGTATFNIQCPAPPGQWYPMNCQSNPIYYQWKDMPLFTRVPHSFYRVPPPPSPTDRIFLEELEITKTYGEKNSTVRTPAQTYSALWWGGKGAGGIGGYRYGNEVAQMVMRNNSNYSIHFKTRVFALHGLATVDDAISNVENKAFYNLWRPIQAIRAGSVGDNPSWDSLLGSVNNQEYPAGHPMHTSAGIHIMRLIFGDLTFPGGFELPMYPTAPSVDTMKFYSLNDFEHSVIMARVFAGLHLILSGRVGVECSHKIAEYAVTNFLLPTKSF